MAFCQNFIDVSSLLEKDSVIYAAVQELFRHFEAAYKNQEEIIDESLIALYSIFGETLEKALELVETDSVKFLHAHAQSIGVFQVEGTLNNNYIIFPFINYCPCLAYKYQVAGGLRLTCKHVLASVIAKIVGKVESIAITPSYLQNLLLAAACINS